MVELPSGTVTFLFTDLEGSTRLREEHPDAMRPALARHDAIAPRITGREPGSARRGVSGWEMPDEDRSDPAVATTPPTDAGPFAVVEGRNTVDYLLFSLQQQMVELTGQADLKGSIIITASSIVLSISATQLNDSQLRWSLVTLLFFVLLALLSSIIAVFPKFRIHPELGDELPPGFNPFFFGHFSQITKTRHLDVMAEVLRDDGMTYRVMVEDVYDQGVYLLKSKYRYLRFSYAMFLVGFLAAAVQLTITVLVG